MEPFFGFRKTLKRKRLRYHLTVKTADLQKIVYTTQLEATVFNDKVIVQHLFVPTIILSPETQANFDKSSNDSFLLSFDSWTTDGQVKDTQLEYQLEIGSTLKIDAPKHWLAADQKDARAAAPNKATNTANVDDLVVGKYFVKHNGVRYPRGFVRVNFNTNNFLDHYRDLDFFMRKLMKNYCWSRLKVILM